MSSLLRISNCLNNDATAFPIVNTYMKNLYKLPESNIDLVNQMGGRGGACRNMSPRQLVESISCSRQVYLRSYTFSRKEYLAAEQTNKCFHQARETSRVVSGGQRRRRTTTKILGGRRRRRWRCVVVVRRVKEFSSTALLAIFHKLLSCAVSVDVVDHKGK